MPENLNSLRSWTRQRKWWWDQKKWSSNTPRKNCTIYGIKLRSCWLAIAECILNVILNVAYVLSVYEYPYKGIEPCTSSLQYIVGLLPKLVVVWLSWLSGRALAAQTMRCPAIPDDCQPFHFPLFLPHNIQIPLFPAWGKMLWAIPM